MSEGPVCHPDWPPAEWVVTLARADPAPARPTTHLTHCHSNIKCPTPPSYQRCNQRAVNGSPFECVKGTLTYISDRHWQCCGGGAGWWGVRNANRPPPQKKPLVNDEAAIEMMWVTQDRAPYNNIPHVSLQKRYCPTCSVMWTHTLSTWSSTTTKH